MGAIACVPINIDHDVYNSNITNTKNITHF
jgi:hypothetical protein